MTDHQLKENLKQGKVDNQYILIGSEPLLIDNTINAIKKVLNINETFDLDTFSLSEVSFDTVAGKLYLTPFGSSRRLIILKNLEEVDKGTMTKISEMLKNTRTGNCLIMTYLIDKGYKNQKELQFIEKTFPHFTQVIFTTERNDIHRWIQSKVKKDHLNLSKSMVQYLEDEFSGDVTGLKNEFKKIENYLAEAESMNSDQLKDLTKGFYDIERYYLVEAFLKRNPEVLEVFERLRPYLHSYAEVVAMIGRGLVYNLLKTRSVIGLNKSEIKGIVEELSTIDRRIKKGSHLGYVLLELFLFKSLEDFRKGAFYGRRG